ncbi:ABC-2 transporter permease [Anaerofustis sp.]|uniref:ABC-2 transporter permease n=1 Tax=Anaerofustis sp. TaxID=1872517 RepID=UPI0025B82D9F|nr:ABC-2 transporter permease [Anaerofustis sp.]
MKGLLLKDLYELLKQCRFIFFLCILYVFLSFVENGYFFVGFAIIFFAMLPTTIMALDERSKWEIYAVTMPYTRKEMVLVKYLLSFLGTFIVAFLYIVIQIVVSAFMKDGFVEVINKMYVILPLMSVGILFSSINLPIVFKFGAEKGRFGTIFICAFLGAIGGGLLSESSLSAGFINFVLTLPVWVYVLFVGIFIVGSYMISVKIYESKEM